MNTRLRLQAVLAGVFAAALCSACAALKNAPEVTHDGLQLTPNSKMEHVWLKPGEDFSQYSRVGLLDAYIAFNKNWRSIHPGMRTYDLHQIKVWLAKEFRNTFATKLRKSDYPLATAPAKDVLLVSFAIVHLEVVAPDTEQYESSTTFAISAGSMALSIELYDSESNEILARAIDRRQANLIGDVEVTSFITDSDDARRLLDHWADLLIGILDEFYGREID